MRAFALAAALLLAWPLHAEVKTVNRYVSADQTRLLSKPTAFAKLVKTLKKGMLVKAEPAHNGYYKVSVPLGDATVSGYLALRALQTSRPSLNASAHKSSDASAEEVAAATKGFNKQIEAGLRADSKDDGFAKLDTALARTKVEDPMTSLEGFRKDGKLGEFKEGGQ